MEAIDNIMTTKDVAAFKVIIKEMKIPHHNRELLGTLYIPEGKERCPMVIFSHGYNGCRNDFVLHAKYLAERGIAAFCFDFGGGSLKDRSGMPTTEMSIFTEKEDLRAVIAAVKALKITDVEKLFLFGASQGGLVTALTVEEIPDEVKGMILLYPAFCIADDWNKRFPGLEDIPEEHELWGMKLGRVYFESIHGFDVFEHVGTYNRQVLVLHGDKDPVVTLDYSERIVQTYEKVQLQVFYGEGHGFTPEAEQKVMELLGEFVTLQSQ